MLVQEHQKEKPIKLISGLSITVPQKVKLINTIESPKMKVYIQLILSILLIIGISCQSSKKGLAGKYGAEGYENNYDTLWLMKDSTYKRKLIQKSTNETFTQEGKWKTWILDNKVRISLNPFYRNKDENKINANIFRSLSSFGTSLMVDNTLIGFRLL